MKLNVNCIRDIMIFVESRPLEPHLNLTKLIDALPQYTEDEIYYNCLKLSEGDLLDVKTVPIAGSYNLGIKSIHHLTFYGHEFLEHIRGEDNWTKIKQTAEKVGSFSISTLMAVATEVITAKVSTFF